MNDEPPTSENIGPTTNSTPARETPPIDTTPASQPATAQQLANVEERMSSFERSTLRLGRYGLAVTVLTGIFIALQWYEMHSGASDTRTLAESAKKQAENTGTQLGIAERQVKATQDQVDAIKRQMRQDQRAWISAASETFGIQGIPVVGQPFVIRTIFKNIGKSAALHLRTCTGADFLPKEQISDFKCPGGIKHFVNSGTMFPGSANFVDLPITPAIQSGDRDKILSNNWNMWVYGRVEYTDVFGVPHWSNFCSHLLSGGGYAICDKHTETDENY